MGRPCPRFRAAETATKAIQVYRTSTTKFDRARHRQAAARLPIAGRSMMNILLAILATELLHAFALSVARFLITAGTWLLSLVMPKEVRDSHRAEVHSDMYEQITHYREEGHSPPSIAVHLIFRGIKGLKDHLALALPYAPRTLAYYLDRSNSAISRGKPHHMVIVTLACLLILNISFLTSQDEMGWLELVFLNACVPVIGWLHSKSKVPWVEKTLKVSAYITLFAGMGVIAWFVVQNRLYSAPFFAEFVTAFAILGVALWGLVTLGGKLLHGHTIRDRGWVVAALLVITILGSVLAANWISGTAEYVGALWLLVCLTVVGFVATVIAALFFALLLWHSGTWVASKSMQAIADTIRR